LTFFLLVKLFINKWVFQVCLSIGSFRREIAQTLKPLFFLGFFEVFRWLVSGSVGRVGIVSFIGRIFVLDLLWLIENLFTNFVLFKVTLPMMH